MKKQQGLLLRGSTLTIVFGSACIGVTPAHADEQSPADRGEIVVTAQRRAELQEDVPMAVTVVSNEAIQNAGVNNLTQIGQVAVGTQMDYSGSVPGISVRGISSIISGYNIESNVSIYIDGLYDPQPVTIAADIANIKSIQVLKGPQGTLYGRNATGGALLVETLGPTKQMTGTFDVSYGRFDTVTANAYVAGPITDKVRFSVTGHYRYGDLSTRLADPQVIGGTIGPAGTFRYEGVRAKLEADLADNLTATLGYNHSKIDDPRAQFFSTYEHIPATVAPPPARPVEFGVVAFNSDTQSFGNTDEVSLKLALNTSIGSLTSLSGYAHRTFGSHLDFDGTYRNDLSLTIDYVQDTYQQSLDWTIDAIDRLTLNVGANYYHDALKQPPGHVFTTYSGAFPISTTQVNAFTNSWAIYADGTYALTDKLHLTLGGRYSYDKKRLNFQVTSPLAVLAVPFIEGTRHWGQFSPRAVLRYELAPRTNVYASVTRGFKAGAFNSGGLTNGALTVAEPETITAYELGLKAAWHMLRFEASAFYYDYKNLQVTVTVPGIAPGTITSALQNAPGAKIKGFEAELTATPVEHLTLHAAISVLDAHYTTFTNAVGTGVNATNTLDIGNQMQDWSGQQLARAPDYSGNVGLDYEIPTNSGTFQFSTNYNFTASYVISNPSLYGPLAPAGLQNKQRYRQGAYGLLSAQLSWHDPSNHFTIAVFGDNITNVSHRLSYNGSAGFGDYSAKADPATYGVRLGYTY